MTIIEDQEAALGQRKPGSGPRANASILLSTTVTVDFGAVAAAGTGTQTAAIANTKVGDSVVVNALSNLDDGITINNAIVSADGTLQVKVGNYTAAPITVDGVVFRVQVSRPGS